MRAEPGAESVNNASQLLALTTVLYSTISPQVVCITPQSLWTDDLSNYFVPFLGTLFHQRHRAWLLSHLIEQVYDNVNGLQVRTVAVSFEYNPVTGIYIEVSTLSKSMDAM